MLHVYTGLWVTPDEKWGEVWQEVAGQWLQLHSGGGKVTLLFY
jgi:hypothetical protein